MKANVGIKIEKPKLELIEACRIGQALQVYYAFEGEEESFMEIMLGRGEILQLVPASELIYEVPESFNPYTGNILHNTVTIDLMDYVSENAEDIARAWLEKRESQLLSLTIQSSINQVQKNLNQRS